ncbi:hypothetical protein H6F88_25690 [Oculatella sp. FACHB-28]|uniref:hypothetical protein n=1 Tax=Oculatella sp. FACHB-28 TaxID=2692845 RepID=UPI0016869874|nr:hypothetical protein [Oculatella sp. FACHB-28]MBD2059349.1 hypothetical protein [Oculatella sp. FACHB-28]
MAKKKSKNKQKLTKQKDSGGEKGTLGASLRQAGTVAASAIAAEIVAATVDRLVQKASQVKNGTSDSKGADQHLEHSKGAMEGATSKVQDGVQAVKPTVRDTAEAVKSSLGEIRPTLADVVDSLKEVAQEILQRSLAIASPAEMTVESALGTAKNVIGAISQTDSKKSEKKSKKNKKNA